MAPLLRALAVLEDPDSIPRILVVAHKCITHLGFGRHQAYMYKTPITHKMKLKKQEWAEGR